VLIDASGNMGIGESAPQADLDIETTSTVGIKEAIILHNPGASAGDGTAITFKAGGTETAIDARIQALADASGGGTLQFLTNLANDATPEVQMTIDETGNV